MPRLFSICIKGAIAVVGCAVLFCVANEPGTAQYERSRGLAIVSNLANPPKRAIGCRYFRCQSTYSFVLCEAVLAQASPTWL